MIGPCTRDKSPWTLNGLLKCINERTLHRFSAHNTDIIESFTIFLLTISIHLLFNVEIGGFTRGNTLLERPQELHTRLASQLCRIFSPVHYNICRMHRWCQFRMLRRYVCYHSFFSIISSPSFGVI